MVKSGLDRWRIEEIRAIEALGSTVHLFQADLSRKEELVSVMDEIRKGHGPSLRGIFHTAGVNRDSVIAMKNESDLRDVFASKALAALHLVEYASEKLENLDFLALFSSVSTELGYYGGSDYAAANGYLDGLAARASRQGVPVIAINWAIWRQIGMGAKVDNTAAAAASGIGNDLVANSLSPAKGAGAMFRVLSQSPSARIAVFPGHFEKRRQLATDQIRAASRPKPKAAHLQSGGSPLPDGNRNDFALDLMLGLWKACLKCETLTCDDNYFQLGGDSLAAISLISGIEETFGQSIPMSFLIVAPTVSKLVEKMGLNAGAGAVEKSPEEEGTSFPAHILPLGSGGEEKKDGPPLFCIHGADGSVMFYKPFADRLETAFSVHAIEAPMLRKPGSEPRGSIEKVAQQYLDDVRMVQPVGPYHFAGYSYGALVAWEMARLALEQGDDVNGVMIYDMYNPAAVRRYAFFERLRAIWQKTGQDSRGLKRIVKFGIRMSQLAGWLVRHATVKLWAKAGTGTEEFKSHVEARIKHDAQIEYYKPQPLNIPVSLIETSDPGDKYDFGEHQGWVGIVPDDVEISTVSGNHLQIFQEPDLSVIVKATNCFLSRISKSNHAERPAQTFILPEQKRKRVKV